MKNPFRLMKRPATGSTVKVYGWAMTGANAWEYYFLDPLNRKQPLALVMGFETEMGAVDMEEIKPYISSFAGGNELADLAPAEGWEWAD